MNNESIIIFCMFCQCYCWTLYPERGRKHVGGVPIGKVAELLDSLPREGTETGWLSDIKVSEENVLLDSSPRNGPGFPPQPHPVIFTLRQTAAALR